MRDAAVAVCRVHVLPAGTFRPKNVDAQVLVCDLNVDFFRFGKNRDSSGGGVDTTAAFRDWHALNAMNPAFEFELGENARAGHAGDDFLETTHVRRAGGDRLYFPALLLGIAAVHAEEIGRASCRERVCQYV